MQGIHSREKQQLNHKHKLIKMSNISHKIQQRDYAEVHTLKDKHHQKNISTSNEFII